MSVQTTADANLELARNRIDQAISCLDEIVVEHCWGWEDFNQEYQEHLENFFHKLLKIRRKLA